MSKEINQTNEYVNIITKDIYEEGEIFRLTISPNLSITVLRSLLCLRRIRTSSKPERSKP